MRLSAAMPETTRSRLPVTRSHTTRSFSFSRMSLSVSPPRTPKNESSRWLSRLLELERWLPWSEKRLRIARALMLRELLLRVFFSLREARAMEFLWARHGEPCGCTGEPREGEAAWLASSPLCSEAQEERAPMPSAARAPGRSLRAHWQRHAMKPRSGFHTMRAGAPSGWPGSTLSMRRVSRLMMHTTPSSPAVAMQRLQGEAAAAEEPVAVGEGAVRGCGC
mmetsp:Transcript_21540/g.59866  ORF Transcript_21540/g.59866 Transcript_21540/m.59866 type:complete len:222 (+) Transcript_21540:2721-3386(+)